MTAEMQKIAHDPNYAVQFAVGQPAPELPPQRRGSGIQLAGVYYDGVKRYVLKSARFSREDVRIFDHDSGQVVYVSHHPGKNPYDMLDPLGMANTDAYYNVAGGEWESLTDVTGYCGMPDFSIRPKTMSFHGRQYIKVAGDVVMNIGKLSKLKSMSLRPHFMVGKGDSSDLEYKCVADMLGRTVGIYNDDEQLVAQVTKTNKAMIKTAVFGSGSESTIDIAPGVDCSTILAVVFGLNQVGQHFMSDAFNNYVSNPIKDNLVGGAVGAAAGAVEGGDDEENDEQNEEELAAEAAANEEAAAALEEANAAAAEFHEAVGFGGGDEESDGEGEDTGMLADAGRFMFNSFFSGGDEEGGGEDGGGWGDYFGGGDDDGGGDWGGDE